MSAQVPQFSSWSRYAGRRKPLNQRQAQQLVSQSLGGDGALIEGPSVKWFPTADQYVRYRGKHSSSQDNHYAD